MEHTGSMMENNGLLMVQYWFGTFLHFACIENNHPKSYCAIVLDFATTIAQLLGCIAELWGRIVKLIGRI